MDTRAFYDRISGAYDLLADRSEGACRDAGLAALELREGERVLEIGCGTGHAVTAMATSVGPTGRVLGVDLSAGMLAVTAGRVSPLRRVALLRGDARRLSVRDGALDAVFISFTLELFSTKDIAVVLREIRRVLHPGGRLGVVSMAVSATDNSATRAYKWLHRHFPHFVDCRPIDVLAHVRRAGFTLATSTSSSIWGLHVMLVNAQRAPSGLERDSAVR